MHELTHASFFSGVGGLDLGLERAGWRTVSFSEIDPYASAVLGQRWPGVPNLGDITDLAGAERERTSARREASGWVALGSDTVGATLWSGGFPCQDLSVAGKRRGLAGSRSGLAFAFLDLVGVHRPRFVLLENVPGLLSSHGGRDMAALLGALVELGYGMGYRVLDARHFGVPQRRRRVFILGDAAGGRAGAERAAEVLSVGSRCRRHPPTGIEAGEGVADGPGDGPDRSGWGGISHALSAPRTTGRLDPNGESYVVGPLDTALGHHGAGWPDQSVAAGHLIGSSPDPDRVRAADGLAGRAHDRGGVVNALDQRRGGADDNEAQAGHLVAIEGRSVMDSDLLPLGLDSHRYRCCGNGVVADVAEWIGWRLRTVIEAERSPLDDVDFIGSPAGQEWLAKRNRERDRERRMATR